LCSIFSITIRVIGTPVVAIRYAIPITVPAVSRRMAAGDTSGTRDMYAAVADGNSYAASQQTGSGG
jgi:hypothetical protein